MATRVTRRSGAHFTTATDACAQIAARADDFALHELMTLRASIEYEYIPDAVSRRRRAGDTWQQIGDDLGISKQAAQQRYGAQADADQEAIRSFSRAR